MSALTLHSMDDNLVLALHRHAAELGTSLNQAAKALAYLRERVWMMDYRVLRKSGYYIGSGIIESACKTLVAARCKLAGMHWRHKNAAGIALLRATMRSNFRIAA